MSGRPFTEQSNKTGIGRLAAAVVKVESNPFPAKLVQPVITMLERTTTGSTV